MSSQKNLIKSPFYDKLFQLVSERHDKTIDVSKLCITINNICRTLPKEESDKYYNEIAFLILHHELLTNNGVLLSSIPYNGKLMSHDTGILYAITNIPPILQQMIAVYLEDPNLEFC